MDILLEIEIKNALKAAKEEIEDALNATRQEIDMLKKDIAKLYEVGNLQQKANIIINKVLKDIIKSIREIDKWNKKSS